MKSIKTSWLRELRSREITGTPNDEVECRFYWYNVSQSDPIGSWPFPAGLLVCLLDELDASVKCLLCPLRR
jgi:hypothetical protein